MPARPGCTHLMPRPRRRSCHVVGACRARMTRGTLLSRTSLVVLEHPTPEGWPPMATTTVASVTRSPTHDRVTPPWTEGRAPGMNRELYPWSRLGRPPPPWVPGDVREAVRASRRRHPKGEGQHLVLRLSNALVPTERPAG